MTKQPKKKIQTMKIYIDADSCPVMVRDYVIKYSAKLQIPLILAANREIKKKDNQDFTMIVLESGKDAADNYIFENATNKDLVITRDILFADRLVEKGVTTINDRGTIFTCENIKEIKSERDLDFQFVEMGLVNHPRGNGYDKSNFTKFANCFDKTINQLFKY